jgi:hypothetical protein
MKRNFCKAYLKTHKEDNGLIFFPEDNWVKPIYQDYFYERLNKFPNFLSTPFFFKVNKKMVSGTFCHINLDTGMTFIVKVFEPNEIIEFDKINYFMIGFTEQQIFDEPESCASLSNRIINDFEDEFYSFRYADKKFVHSEKDVADLASELNSQQSRKNYIPKALHDQLDLIENKKQQSNHNFEDNSGLPF